MILISIPNDGIIHYHIKSKSLSHKKITLWLYSRKRKYIAPKKKKKTNAEIYINHLAHIIHYFIIYLISIIINGKITLQKSFGWVLRANKFQTLVNVSTWYELNHFIPKVSLWSITRVKACLIQLMANASHNVIITRMILTAWKKQGYPEALQIINLRIYWLYQWSIQVLQIFYLNSPKFST